MDFLEKNLFAMGKMQNAYCNKLKTQLSKKERKLKFEIYKNPFDQDVLKYENSDGSLIHYTSYLDPLKQAKEMIQDIEHTNRHFIFVVGIGLGYHIDLLLENINKKSLIVIIEKDMDLIIEVLKRKDYSRYIESGSLQFIIEDDNNIINNNIIRYMRTFKYNIPGIQGVRFSIFDKEYNNLANKVYETIMGYRKLFYDMLGNSVEDTLHGIRNRFNNASRYIKSPGVVDLKERFGDKYKGKPLIIVSSGPSLDKNIDFLKDAKGKALILACDSVIDTLKNKSIVPNAVGVLERGYEIYDKFFKDKTFDDEIVLAAVASAEKEVVNTFDNKVLAMFREESCGRWFDNSVLNKGCINAGASVAHLLFGIGYYLECDPIILIGQDLAYSKEGISHANGSKVREKVELDNVTAYVEGQNGEMLPTISIWEYFKKIFEDYIKVSKCKVIDATEGGALIKGAEILPLKKAIEMYCKEEVVSLRQCVDAIEVKEDFVVKARQNLLRESQEEIRIIDKLIKRINKAIIKNKGAMKSLKKGIHTQKDLNKVYNCIDFTEEKIVKEIINNETLGMILQYIIHSIAYKVSELEEKEYTFDVLKKNLKIQMEFLLLAKYYLQLTFDTYKKGVKIVEENIS